MERIGTVETICRHPVKSMAGEDVAQAFVGFAGLMGDRALLSFARRGPRASPGTPGASRRIWSCSARTSVRAEPRPCPRISSRPSRRGLSHDDSAPISSQNASFPSYKAPRVHHAARWRGGRVAAHGARAAAGSGYTVGILSAGGDNAALNTVLVAALRELGWVEGKNVVFEYRYAENRLERLPDGTVFTVMRL
jgi:hypothetical protein